MKSGIILRIKNKLRLIKAKGKISKGITPESGWTISETQEYWKVKANQEEDDNRPENYANSPSNEIRAKFFLNKLKNLQIKKEEPILELGTNAGYVMSFLYNNGYRNITGIEINSNALKTMKEKFPDGYNNCNLINDSLEVALPKLTDNSFSLVYSMGVLMHIHPKSNFIFDHIARVSNKYIITIEGEMMLSSRHFPRNYKDIFEKRGFKQTSFEMTENKIPDYANLHYRIFSKDL